MTDANEGWSPTTGEVERIKQLFADAFGNSKQLIHQESPGSL